MYMAAFVALGNALTEEVADTITSFLYRSQTVVATCDTDASDIANLADVSDVIQSNRVTPHRWIHCYQESLELDLEIYVYSIR